MLSTCTNTFSEPLTLQTILDAMDRLQKIKCSCPPRLKIIESIYLTDTVTEQIKFPRSKKKRIRKKFRKLWMRGWEEPKKEAFIANGVMYCHPVIAKSLKEAICSVSPS